MEPKKVDSRNAYQAGWSIAGNEAWLFENDTLELSACLGNADERDQPSRWRVDTNGAAGQEMWTKQFATEADGLLFCRAVFGALAALWFAAERGGQTDKAQFVNRVLEAAGFEIV